jgi:hypothetical protein
MILKFWIPFVSLISLIFQYNARMCELSTAAKEATAREGWLIAVI